MEEIHASKLVFNHTVGVAQCHCCLVSAHRHTEVVFGTGSTALTPASSIAPCLFSNDFLHFSVISQAWNSPARRMDIS